ncbi:MAG TPA: sugar ABC transporter permease [Geminicoccaceae bacterium]|nr:sugar ABC transporter permease [Geminicoccus sp.]HMU51921.1 sugar ABC transporter permease [Geminicoccaceae bacterium]
MRTAATVGSGQPAVSFVQRLRSIDWTLSRPGNHAKLGYLLLLPAVLMILAIIVYPLVLSIDLSFQDVKIARIGAARKDWTLLNYQRLFSSPEFWRSCWVTLKLVTIVTGLCFAIGLGSALLLNLRFRGRALARLLAALPWAIPEVVAVVVWWWIFDSSFGVLNWALVTLGIAAQPVAWFSSGLGAFSVVVVVMVWKGYPFVFVMLLAGLQSIPHELYEAAKVDGATAWQRFRHVTLPCLRPVLGITLALVVLWVFRDFSIIYVLTQGGPVGATETLAIKTYEESFGFYRMGSGAALGVITLIVCAVTARFMVGRGTRLAG